MILGDGRRHVITYANKNLFIDGIPQEGDTVIEFTVTSEEKPLEVFVYDAIKSKDMGPSNK